MEAAQTLAQNDQYHNGAVLNTLQLADYIALEDRPGWIPSDILYDWDTCPYAYQTEEELMPAGGLHGEILTYIAEILRNFLKTKGLRFLADTFVLYRDHQGIKQRIAPDFTIMPFRQSPPSAYDLDFEPPPLAVMEITSPKSRAKDMHEKVNFYANLGIPACLVIDSITSDGISREQVRLHLWRGTPKRFRKIKADAQGYLRIPEMKLKVMAQGDNLTFADIVTGDILCDVSQLQHRINRMSERAERESERAEQESKRADMEKQRAERLAAKLRDMGVSPE